ncbi:unnamed protein product [Colias eurytheme]|nr:unnamed protein product [Colias eurytheme]
MDLQLDVIVLTECWTNAESSPPLLAHYNMFYSRNSLNQNDGIVAYVRSEWNSTCHEPVMAEANIIVSNNKVKAIETWANAANNSSKTSALKPFPVPAGANL